MAAGVTPVTSASDWAAIDWSAPWLAPWRGLGQPMALEMLSGPPVVHAVLERARSRAPALPGIHFVAHSDLPIGCAYEKFIFDTRGVPTRDNLHDFFNGLVWMQFPHTKRRLNELQAQAIAVHGVRAVRGPLRDALTVFDENGAVMHAPAKLWDALRARDWQRLWGDLRPLWSQVHLVLFGHALLEKLVYPRKPMVAHVYQAHNAHNSVADLDGWLAQNVQPEPWSTKPFVPLPVLGVPGWWPANEAPGFYDDPRVFRAARA